MRISIDQRRVLSESMANVGVVWFAGGVVGPAFTVKDIKEAIIPGAWGVIMTVIFITLSLLIIKRK